MEVEDAEHISGDGNSNLESEDDETTLFDENVEDDSLSATTAVMNQASKNVSKKKKNAFKFGHHKVSGNCHRLAVFD
jgi:hypothetical protein